jgi:hypothetical protein
MFNKEHSKQLIESLYLKNDKSFDKTLDQFLNNNIPKDEYKLVVVTPAPAAPEKEMINTSSSKAATKSDLLQ